MARFCDARALCRTAKGIDRIGKIGKGHFYRHQRRNGGKVLFVRVLIGFIEVMLHHLFQGDKVIHGRFGKKDILFHKTRNRIPFGLIVMPEGPAIPEPVKRSNTQKKNNCIEGAAKKRRGNSWIGKTGKT